MFVEPSDELIEPLQIELGGEGVKPPSLTQLFTCPPPPPPPQGPSHLVEGLLPHAELHIV